MCKEHLDVFLSTTSTNQASPLFSKCLQVFILAREFDARLTKSSEKKFTMVLSFITPTRGIPALFLVLGFEDIDDHFRAMQ